MNLIDPAPEGLWPITIAGWATLVIATSTMAVLLYDKIAGKSKSVQRMETQLERLQSEVEDLNSTQLILSNHIKSLHETLMKLTYQLSGVDGQNGARGDIKEIRQELAEIQRRNREMDILAAQYRAETSAAGYEGVERREHLRRMSKGRRFDVDNT